MKNIKLHKVTITLEGTKNMLEMFIDAYEKASDLYDTELDLETEGFPKEMWDFGDDPNTSILQHYRSDIYWSIKNYLSKIDK